MKHLSIKARVALWYAFSLLAILVLVAVLLLAAGDRLILDEAQGNLTAVTDRCVGDVLIQGGKLSIDNDIVYYSDGAYVMIYREDRTLISGLRPEGFPEETAFAADEIRRVKGGASSFYVYDRLIENQKVGNIWVRGVVSARMQDMAPSVMKMIRGFLIVLPVLFLIALAGGWLLTRQAFLPLQKIVRAADHIRTSGELDMRIGLGSREDADEIRQTAAVFDAMLDQIQDDFEMEKRFTNDASHELRTPIAVILAQSEFALENLDEKAEVEESLQEIRRQAQGMSALVSQLLVMARAERGIEQMKKQPTDLAVLAEESAGRFARMAKEYGIRVQVSTAEDCYVNGDEVFLGRMFDNLLDNAIKYGKVGGFVEISVSREKEQIRVCVRDDGIGIDPQDLPHIWERFYRADHSGKTAHKDGIGAADDESSMGIGLALVRWIVEEHGGKIHAESTPGEGTAFEILLPGYQQKTES